MCAAWRGKPARRAIAPNLTLAQTDAPRPLTRAPHPGTTRQRTALVNQWEALAASAVV